MPNNFFQFKQFTVKQDKCAMKVCTDACLFGAAAASIIEGKSNLRILDIGTGTGLLSLMLTQKNKTAIIDAIEIDETAAQQAAENFAASPWHNRLSVHHTSLQQFLSLPRQINGSANTPFNFIISNPPFFDNDLKSEDNKRNIALHSSELSLEELVSAIDKLLIADGMFGVLLPYHRTTHFEKLAFGIGFYIAKKISVKQTPRHKHFRSILFFSREKISVNDEEIVIKDAGNNYSPAFTELLKDYYLYL